MLQQRGGYSFVTGLEIQAAQEIFGNAGYQIVFDSLSWSDMLAKLRTGSIDFVMGAYYDKKRTEYVHYSIPYRYERNAVYVHESIARKADNVDTMDGLLKFLSANELRMAAIGVIEDYVYGSDDFARFLRSPPDHLEFVPSRGYSESMNLILQGYADFFVANPVIADRILAETGAGKEITRLPVQFPQIPVHVMFSKATITLEEVESFNQIIDSMVQDNRFRSLHIEFLLPVYLAITMDQSWFHLLTMLGIAAFSFSGVLLARKERYNLVGALVLAILPAIGGGVLRDIFLGADKVFVLHTPAFMLVAVAVVILSFLCFKAYDCLMLKFRKNYSNLDKLTQKHLEGMFNRLFKFFDAWAVATFTIVGVNAAVESQAGPLWLWGPAMGALTASGGVVLRDIVRADYNIEMLKQDSYAEISILGGIVYTGTLLLMPYEINPGDIFYLTMFMIALLFAARFIILWIGFNNPLQFGAAHTHPDARMKEFEELEPSLWKLMTEYFTEDSESRAMPVNSARAESLHNQFLYLGSNLKESLAKAAAEPLSNQSMRNYIQCRARLKIALDAENIVYLYVTQMLDAGNQVSDKARHFQQLIDESLKGLIEAAQWAIESGEPLDFTMLEGLTLSHHKRFNEIRSRYGEGDPDYRDHSLQTALRATHKIERITYLLGDYVLLRLSKKETGAGGVSNRKVHNMLSKNT